MTIDKLNPNLITSSVPDDGKTISYDAASNSLQLSNPTVATKGTTYANLSSIPLSGNSLGDIALTDDANRIYIWNGNGWYSIATVNQSPNMIVGANASYSLDTAGANTVIQLVAEDPEGLPIVWNYSVTSGSLDNTATVVQNANTFTITPSTVESDAGTFSLTFTASDGVNIATTVAEFTLEFPIDWAAATQQAKIQASDKQADDWFGRSVAISGDGSTAIVGATKEDTGADDVGAAYIFTRSGTSWSQQAKIQASDKEIYDQFGLRVSISQDGNTAAVHSYGEDTGGSNAGAVYIFTRSGSTWTQQSKLKASDAQASDYFGISVSISADGNTIIAGANGEDTGASNAGAAYIFVRSGSTWTQQAKIQASDREASDSFGDSAAISGDGNTAIVGATGEDTGASSAGAAYIFVRSGSSWAQQAKIQASDKQANDFFGSSVAISGDGNTAIVGARYEDAGGTDAGAAYIFTRSGTSWTQQSKILAGDRQSGDEFGRYVSISIDGNIVVVGAWSENSEAGAAYVFTRSGSTWTQQKKIQASDRQTGDRFGEDLDISDDGKYIIVGAFFEDTGGTNAGAAYIFKAG